MHGIVRHKVRAVWREKLHTTQTVGAYLYLVADRNFYSMMHHLSTTIDADSCMSATGNDKRDQIGTSLQYV